MSNPSTTEIDAELARRHHKDFIKYLWQNRSKPFIDGIHIDKICGVIDESLQDFSNGISTYLALKVPYRHSKSTIASEYLPCNFIGKHPDLEVMVVGYAAGLVRTFSRHSKKVMLDEKYYDLYPDVKLSEDEQSMDEWGIDGKVGKVHWIGLDGTITGKGGSCFPAGTMVYALVGAVDIADLHRMTTKPLVLSFNHKTNTLEWKKIIASNERMSNELVRITTVGERIVTATTDHPFFTEENGYVLAGSLKVGQKIRCGALYSVPRVRENEIEKKAQDSLLAEDTVSVVERISTKENPVYDIQVEGNHNFFANEILVHNCVIVDDFFKGREEAESVIIRDKVWDAIANNVITRLAEPSLMIILATPWHVDDPFGRIQEKMKVDVDFPAFREIKFPAKDISYHTGYLWPERFSETWYKAQFASKTPYEVSSILQCDPVVAGGNLLKTDKVTYYTESPTDIQYSRGWDLASTQVNRLSQNPDYTVGIRLGVRWTKSQVEGESIPELYVDDMIRGRWEASQRKKIIRDTAMGDGCIPVAVEGYGAYKDAYTELVQTLHGLRTVKKSQLPGDKVTKARPLEVAFLAGNVHLKKAPWNDDFLYEVGLFPGGKHDDVEDSMCVALDCHNPFVQNVWPSFGSGRIADFKLDFVDMARRNLHHYGSFNLRHDMALYFLSCVWDAENEKLFVYDNYRFEFINNEEIVSRVMGMMKMATTGCEIEKMVGNSLMFPENFMANSVSRQLNKLFKTKIEKNPPHIQESIHYDPYGSIQRVDDLFKSGNILVNRNCEDAIRQFSSWSVERGKPSEEDCGFCEALCLLISEMSRKKIIPEKPKIRDYHRTKQIVENKFALSP